MNTARVKFTPSGKPPSDDEFYLTSGTPEGLYMTVDPDDNETVFVVIEHSPVTPFMYVRTALHSFEGWWPLVARTQDEVRDDDLKYRRVYGTLEIVTDFS